VSALRRASLSSAKSLLPPLCLTVYLTVYDSLLLWYCAKGMVQKPHRNRHFSDSQMSGNGFRGLCSSSSQLDAAQSQWGNRLRTGIRALRRLPWRVGGAGREGPTGARFIRRWTHASINRGVQGVEERFFPLAPSRPTPILSNGAFVPVTEVPAFLESRPDKTVHGTVARSGTVLLLAFDPGEVSLMR
jgi:hypothetical protein